MQVSRSSGHNNVQRKVSFLSKDAHQLEQNKREDRMSFLAKVIVTGFVGGVFWSSIGLLAYVFNFTKISPTIIIQSWVQGSWHKNWQGMVISVLLIGIISIGVAFIYYGLFRKVDSMWGGVIFGIGLFFIVIFLLHPLFPSLGPIKKLSLNTIVTTVCLYILYGLFVGYSISYEENEFQQGKNSTTQ